MKTLSRTSPLTKSMNLTHAWHVPHPLMQRKCQCGGIPGPTGECAECRQRRGDSVSIAHKHSPSLQERGSSGQVPQVSVAPPIVNEVLHSPGQPLDPATRAFMEPRFGHDFGNVRVHIDAKAADSARAVNALAYTVGRDVVFGQGKFSPAAGSGRQLLAHELAHVIQQQGFEHAGPQSLTIGPTGDALEREADCVANSVAEMNFAGRVPDKKFALPSASDGTAKIQARPGSRPIQRQVPSGISIKEAKSFGHSDLAQEEDKKKFLTSIGAVTLMHLTPPGDYTAGQKKGECTKEFLTEVSNTCPAHDFCKGDRCLEVGRYGSSGDPPTKITVTDGPDTFIDRHVTRFPTSFLEGSGKDKCSVVCHQRYKYRTEPDRQYHDLGSFYIIRNFRAGKYTEPGGKSSINITTGEIKKVPAGLEAPSKEKFAKDIAPGLTSSGVLLEPPPAPSVQRRVSRTLQRDSFRGDDDPIHKPIIESYRREHGLPLSGVNEFGEPVGPSAAEIKYGRTSKPTEVNVPPPPSQKLSVSQAAAVANQPLPANVSVSGGPSSPAKPATTGKAAEPFIEPLKREPIQFGLDFSIDTTLTKQASILPRHFDIYRISLHGIPIDLGHEPTGSVGLSLNPKNFGTLTALLSISTINVHFQQHGKDFIELALGQIGIGYDSDKNTFVPLTAQAEIHSPNEHFSIYLNGSGTWTHAPGQGWTVTWAPLTMGILFHVLNP